MEFPETKLLATDVSRFWQVAKEALVRWGSVKTLPSPEDVEVYRHELLQAKQGIATIEDYCENQVSEWKKKLGAAKLMRKDIENHVEMAKGRYWALRKEEAEIGV